MDLDSRIIEGKSYLDCFDTEIGKKFIGKECYLSDGVASFANIDELNKATLKEVDDENIKPYTLENIRWRYLSNFILPCEWVGEEKNESEKKYKAFSLNEFSELYAIGDVVTFRLKDCEVIEQSMLIGFQSSHDEDIPGEGYVLIGNCRYGFMELFNDYELKHLNHWQPFGIEVEE